MTTYSYVVKSNEAKINEAEIREKLRNIAILRHLHKLYGSIVGDLRRADYYIERGDGRLLYDSDNYPNLPPCKFTRHYSYCKGTRKFLAEAIFDELDDLLNLHGLVVDP